MLLLQVITTSTTRRVKLALLPLSLTFLCHRQMFKILLRKETNRATLSDVCIKTIVDTLKRPVSVKSVTPTTTPHTHSTPTSLPPLVLPQVCHGVSQCAAQHVLR